ncbi:DUF3885 domain-containing protein [Niallia sp. FSL W8-0635]|uniref:DUF3885 domain-containing protein n=1 Tax=Niallia sp. FSL W8-0635 TaxID=2975337 RepID=UPI0009D25F3B|nr:Uncharacterised protein [Mycobacteroides abscessus subsp. abscessus]HEO8421979.1 DUF3885 domain-containing protein [Yersinia enterocolitica]
MNVKEYIDSTFPGLVLKPGLNQQWNNRGIHFEFAKELYPLKEGKEKLNPAYFRTVYHQAISLFHHLFALEDKFLFVTNIYWYKDDARRRKKKIKAYNYYIKSKDVLFSLKQETLPYLFEEEEALDYCTSQFSLECTKQDIIYPLLIQAICNQDFPSLKPRLSNPYYSYEPDIFLINVTKNIIFFIYDDRGCEVIAENIETLHPLYRKYRDWVDEYYLEKIEGLFSSRPHVSENQDGR